MDSRYCYVDGQYLPEVAPPIEAGVERCTGTELHTDNANDTASSLEFSSKGKIFAVCHRMTLNLAIHDSLSRNDVAKCYRDITTSLGVF